MTGRQLQSEPEDWGIAEVSRLVRDRIPEGQRLDYKRTLQLDTKKQRTELCKDISGLANAQGGWLIFGIDEGEGEEPVAGSITPIAETGLQTRLENILDSALAPVPSYRAATIPAEDQGVVIVVKVESAIGRPVMIQGYEQNRYFIRSGTRTRPMDEPEVTRAHAVAQRGLLEAEDRLRGLPLIAEIPAEMRVLPLDDYQATPVICVVAAGAEGSEELISRQQVRPDAFEDRIDGYLGARPVRSSARWTINHHGLLDEESEDPPLQESRFPIHRAVEEGDLRLVSHRAAIYRRGVVEWARRYDRVPALPSRSLAEDVHNALLFSARVFAEIAYVGALKIWIRLEHAESAELSIPSGWDISPRAPGVDVIDFSTDLSAERLLLEPLRVTREGMDALWQGFGVGSCIYFDQQGNWIADEL